MTAQENGLNTVTILRRNKAGNLYHRADCKRVTAASIPWIWAEGKTRAEVLATWRNGIRPCMICRPLDALPEWVPERKP